jgi:hypothetical protein
MSEVMHEDKDHALDYDGIGTTVFPSIEAANSFIHDPEHQKIVSENPRTFLQESAFRVVAGNEVVLLNTDTNK